MQIGEYIDSYSPVIDGVVTCVKNYAYWLNQKHGNCYVAAPRCPGYEDTDPFSVYRFTSVPVPKKPPYRFGVSALDYRYHKAMAVQYPQLVHAHSPFTAGWDALRFAKRRDIPIVATFHSKFYDRIHWAIAQLHPTCFSLLDFYKRTLLISQFFSPAELPMDIPPFLSTVL